MSGFQLGNVKLLRGSVGEDYAFSLPPTAPRGDGAVLVTRGDGLSAWRDASELLAPWGMRHKGYELRPAGAPSVQVGHANTRSLASAPRPARRRPFCVHPATVAPRSARRRALLPAGSSPGSLGRAWLA